MKHNALIPFENAKSLTEVSSAAAFECGMKVFMGHVCPIVHYPYIDVSIQSINSQHSAAVKYPSIWMKFTTHVQIDMLSSCNAKPEVLSEMQDGRHRRHVGNT